MARNKGRVVKIEYVNKKVMFCRIEHIEPATLEFRAGQYLVLLLPNGLQRAYSIANSPEQKNYLETYADITPGGPGSQFFLNAKVGDFVSYAAPVGRFLYEESSDPAIFVAGNTGIVPFFSMIEYALKSGSKRDMFLVWGNRKAEYFFAEEKLNEFKKYPNFQLIKTLNEEVVEGYEKGSVLDHFEALIAKFGKSSHVYLCGGKEMIVHCENKLLELGIDAKNIRYEKFS